MCPYPASSQAAITAFREGMAISMASRRVRFMRAPEWITTRLAPIHSAASQAETMYPMVFCRLSGSGLARLMK
jgi:hypothetical protein